MISGKVYIKAGNTSIFVGESTSYNVSTTTRSTETGLSGFAGISEVFHIPFVEFQAIALEETDIRKLEKIVNVPVILKLANGKTYLFNNASKVGDTDWDEKSRGTIRFEGADCQEV